MTMTLTGSGTGTVGVPNSGTAQNSTSGTSIDFTGIPAGTKRITVMFNGVSTNGTSQLLLQIGAGSVTTTGYTSTAGTRVGESTSTAGFLLTHANQAANTAYGTAIVCLLGSNTWIQSGIVTRQGDTGSFSGGGIALGGTLDRVRITTVNSTDTFDAGSINILYE